MIKNLKRIAAKTWYSENGEKKQGVHSKISGDVSGIYGNVNRISGDIDNCQITSEERKKGVNIADLLKGV